MRETNSEGRVFRRWRRLASASLALSAFIGCGLGEDGEDRVPDPPFAIATAPKPRGLVLIVIDTLRADHVGVYGRKPTLTPAIDALAARSYVFEGAMATSSWTRPSIASILTSRYPTALAVLDKKDLLDERALLLPEILQQELGFRTYAVTTNGNVNADHGFAQGYDEFVAPAVSRGYPGDFPIFIAESVTERAIGILDRHPAGVPFFLFLHYVDPHDPYLPHPGLLETPEPPGRFDGSRQDLEKLGQTPARDRTPDDLARIRHLYAGEVRYCDLWIGRFLEALAERDLADETMVIVTSDHGEGLWDHGRRAHGNDLFEETVRVPLVVHLPGMGEDDARRVLEPVSLVDIAPTVLAALEAHRPGVFQGYDLLPLTQGQTRHPALAYVYSEMDHRGLDFESLRHGRYKLIRNREPKGDGGPPQWQLFDLEGDPSEKRNLAGQSEAERDRLQQALERWSLAVTAAATHHGEIDLADLDRETLDSLRALGYIAPAEHSRALENTTASEKEPSTRRAAAPRKPPKGPGLSALDFLGPRPVPPQLFEGLTVAGPGVPARLASGAAVTLERGPAHTRWQLRGEADFGRGEVERLRLDVVADDSVSSTVRLSEPGLYTIQGDLPPNGAGVTRLDIECRLLRGQTEVTPEGSCLAVHSVRLQ